MLQVNHLTPNIFKKLFILAMAGLDLNPAFSAPSAPPNGALPRSAWIAMRRSDDNHLGGYPAHEDETLGVTTFLWAAPEAKRTAPRAAAKHENRARRAELTTRNFLAQNGVRLGLTKHTIAAARLHELHDIRRGPLIARYQQTHQGVEVFGRRLNVMLDQEFRPLAAAGYFAPDDSNAREAALRAAPSVASAPNWPIAPVELDGQLNSAVLEPLDQSGAYTRLRVTQQPPGPYRVTGTPRGKRVYFPLDNQMVPAWYLEIALQERASGKRHAYGYVVAAGADGIGRVVFRNSHIAHDTFSYRVFADTTPTAMPWDSPLGNDRVPLPLLDKNLNLARVPAVPTLVTQTERADPWLPVGATETVGNNVDAYVDVNGVNGLQTSWGDFRAPVSSAQSFDYALRADTDPTTTTARNAAIVNLFYLNNFMHDWWYGNGFDEAAGNAQTNNYGRGGVEGDPLRAEAQDYSDYDNADMETPADGASPRMQMYLWNPITPANTALSVAGMGSLIANNAEFGPLQFDVSGTVTSVTPAAACTTLNNPNTITGKIALIDRGFCTFVTKARRAQQAGASGVIIVNNIADGSAPSMAGLDSSIVIPVVSTSFADGARIKSALNQGGTVTARLYRTATVALDGALDNTIVAHEWFHYVSNRLVGDGDGLSNAQGQALGEGWSDVNALLLVARPEDATLPGNANFSGAYPLVTYVMPSAYFGIRRAPYSTNRAVFPLTFKHIADSAQLPSTAPLTTTGALNSEIHNAGEIWANTLWDFYVSLLNDPRYSFIQAQERMKDYLIASLKMTPFAPTFLEARDALLAAVKATDGTDFQLATRSFAKYGMGIDAVAPPRNSSTNAGVVESFVALAGAYNVTWAGLDFSQVTGCRDSDKVLDVGETIPLKVFVRDTGISASLPQVLKAHVTSDSNVVLGNSGAIIFGAFNADGIASGTIPVTLKSADPAATIKLALTFPQAGATPDAVREPQPQTVTLRVNYDLKKSFSVDDVERSMATTSDWSRAFTGQGAGWRVTNDFNARYHTGQAWFVPDNDTPSEAFLTSPAISVGNQPFAIEFDSLFQFEIDWEDGGNYGYDGGVVEIKIDNGEWQDVLIAGGRFTKGGYNSQLLVFAPTQSISTARLGFGRSSAGFTQHALNFGTLLAGHTVYLRFRAASDPAVGDLGWMVDNIRLTGAAGLPFSDLIPNAMTCAEK